MGKETTYECSNSRKSYFGEKFRVIVYCPIPKNDNSELGKCIFYGLVKLLIDPVGLKETRQTWTMFSELKALVDSEKFRIIVFGYREKNDNLELGIFTSKHDSTCHKKIRVIVFMKRAINDIITRNSEFTWERIPSFPRIPSYRYGRKIVNHWL